MSPAWAAACSGVSAATPEKREVRRGAVLQQERGEPQVGLHVRAVHLQIRHQWQYRPQDHVRQEEWSRRAPFQELAAPHHSSPGVVPGTVVARVVPQALAHGVEP